MAELPATSAPKRRIPSLEYAEFVPKPDVVRIPEILDALAEYDPAADIDLVQKAYVYSAQVHQGQLRTSGEPYLNHPLWVAYILTQLHGDAEAVAAGLLHDAIEDTIATREDIAGMFDEPVAALVDGVTKLGKIEYQSSEERQADSFRKMFVAMASDLRVILIKLADRLHNMRTLHFLAEPKQKKIARETLDLYAPLAGRLGIQWVKAELEDLSLAYLDPEAYADIRQNTETYREQQDDYFEAVIDELTALLNASDLQGTVNGRQKHIFSIHRKIESKNIPLEQVYDLIAFRIMVEDVPDCYAVLGSLHSKWKPIPGRFKDFIAMPKANGYQSLHTTVIGPAGRPIEIQIRTQDMHMVAEQGVAAHWAYKEADVPSEKEQQLFGWLRNLYDWHDEVSDPQQFVEAVKLDLFQEEVYVFTPTGDVIELPKGSTPVDFAYKIHTEVGHHMQGAKVNGRLVTLSTPLKTGDIVEVLNSDKQQPRRHWLKYAYSSNARRKIRSYLNRKELEQAQKVGKTFLEQALRESGLSMSSWTDESKAQVLKELALKDVDQLVEHLGYGRVLVGRLKRILKGPPSRRSARLRPALGRLWRKPATKPKEALLVEGIEGVETAFAKCCNPVPGDPIVGLVRVAKGIRVHRKDCIQLNDVNPERLVRVEWASLVKDVARVVQLRLQCDDIPGLLGKVGSVIAEHKVNIKEVTFRPNEHGASEGLLAVLVQNREELDRIIQQLKRLKGVARVERI